MSDFFASGMAVDLVLAVLVLEAVWLAASRRMTVAETIAALLPGALLALALRASLTGAAWPWIALFLTASLPAHLADLALRQRASPPGRKL